MEDKQETVTIRITKRFLGDKPSHWEVEVDDHHGDMMGIGTSPTFNGAFEMSYEFISGDSGDFDAIHNEWIDFDANKAD